MRNLRRLRKLWNDVLDGLEAAVLAWVLKTALERHKPVPIETNHGLLRGSPSVMEPWCMVCVKHWPCKRWEEVAGLAEKLDIDGP
jgi:hypothetical protein